ncbi:iron-sulfur cluster-binding protein [Nocardioides limicola]|uniref:iron-sulfur cluster-binding protein n=1 Tax=Nocardioides limicola TaxID=2803368 RepID=UPI00193AFE9D|nr:hypothetical protein [Nocardioides sp. DJM-14]
MTNGADRRPVHVTADVVSAKRIGAFTHLTLRASGISERFRPGTFVALSHGADRSLLARRALWIHRVRTASAYGPCLDVVVDPVGTTTRWLAGLAVGASLELTGPLGRPFALPQEPVPCLLVGEGVDAAALFPLAERLRERGCPVHLLLGAEREDRLLSALEARRTVRAVTVMTADGSVGLRGSVADRVAESVRSSSAAVVYAAGSHATLRAAASAAVEQGAWSQVLVTPSMPCGTGLCHGCAVPVIAEHGAARTVRGCTEGPVFRGDRVRWDAMEVR